MFGFCARCASVALVLVAGLAIPRAEAQETLTLEPCELQGVLGETSCGTLQVYEDREAMSGRKIGINIVVLHATGQSPAPDPFVFIPGGPGESATELAGYIAQAHAGIRQGRDILLVDQRGTGGSHPLNCEFYGSPDDPQSYLGRFFPIEDVETCRSQLESSANLGLYTTPLAMDDLDDVRQALGYEQLNLFGGSYGTRAVQVYLRRHGAHTRTAILHGVTTTGAFIPRDLAPDAQRALEGVIDDCLADESCAGAFPDIRGEVESVFSRLEAGPVPVEVLNPLTGDIVEIQLSRDNVAEAVRYLLYGSGSAGNIPVYIHHAAQGDFTPLGEYALFERRFIVASGSNGMYLSVTCAEDVPFIEPGEGERLAKGTFLGDYRVRDQRDACAVWRRGDIPEDYAEPIRSSVPILILSGQWDPVTPPQYGDYVSKYLENSLHVVVPYGGHGFNGLEGVDCIDGLMEQTVEQGSVEGLDTSCVQEVRRPPFPVSLPPMKPIAMSDQELQPYAGRYAAEGPFAIIAEVAGGKLKIDAGPQGVFFAVPVTSDRFRVAGVSDVYILFTLEEDAVTQLAVEQSGNVIALLDRQDE